MPPHSKAKLTAAARKIIPFIDTLFKDKDIRVNEVADFLKNNYCLRVLGNADTGMEPYQDFYQAFTGPVTSMTAMVKILKDFKACDPGLWGKTNIFLPDVLNGVDDFMDAAAFHMEAVAFYAMITHMSAGNDVTDEKASLKGNYPVAYLIAKFTESRSIDVAALRSAVKSRLKNADLPGFCTRKDYLMAIAYFLTSTENDEGVVVPATEDHVNHAKNKLPKPRLYGEIFEVILTDSINKVDDGQVTEPEPSDSDDDSDSDSDSDSDDDEQAKRSRRKRKARRSGKASTKKRKAAKGLGSRFAYTSPPSKRGNIVSFADDTRSFKAGDTVKVSASDISLDPSKAKYWRGLAVVAFDKEGNRLNGTIARIFSPDKEGNPLRFQFKSREGVLFDHTCDIFTTAQHVLAATIDKANGDDGDADVLAMAAKAKQMALGTTEGPLPNHLTDQMNRQITSTDYDVLQSLESLPENALKYGLVALTSGRQLIFLRFIYKTSVTTLANIEFGICHRAHEVSLRLPIDCNGVVISPGLILKWVYFAFDSYSLQDLAPARTSDTSATASNNDDKQAVIFSDGGIPCITAAKTKVKRKEVASVVAVENCLDIMQYLWIQFYDNNFVYAYFAKLRALLTKVKRDFGEDNFTIVKEFITFFVRGERRRLFAHIGAGHTIESFSPFGSPAEVAKMMANLREISNQHTARVVLNLTGQLAAANSGSQQAGSSRGRQSRTSDGRTIDHSHPDTPKKGPAKRTKGKRGRDADSKSMPPPAQPKKTRASGDSPGHTDRLDRATRAGFKTVRDFVKDFADSRKARGDPVACIWQSITPDKGGPLACTNPNCPACQRTAVAP
jgi:hypothetical protein